MSIPCIGPHSGNRPSAVFQVNLANNSIGFYCEDHAASSFEDPHVTIELLS